MSHKDHVIEARNHPVQKLCGLCHLPLDPEHQEIDRYAGVLCHEDCIEVEERANDDWYAR